MSEQREYFRISILARVGLRVLPPEAVEEARSQLKQRHPPAAMSPSALDESGLAAENRIALDLLQRIALSLDRIDRRLDEFARERHQPDEAGFIPAQAIMITLSASGFSGPFSVDVTSGDLVEVQLDLWESGLPLITALAHVINVQESDDGRHITAFSFDEILAEDQERIVQLTLRSQSQALRESRRGEER